MEVFTRRRDGFAGGDQFRIIFSTALVVFFVGTMIANVHAAWENGYWATVFEPFGVVHDVRTTPDGAGGMLIIAYDPGAQSHAISVSRIDHTGNELWGDDGVKLGVEIAYPEMLGPVDVTDDGQGGAYCLYTRVYDASHTLMVTRLNGAGLHVSTVPLGDYGPNPTGAARLEKSDNGDLFVVWSRSAGTVDKELIVARLDADLNPIWETTVWEDSNGDLDRLDWVVNEDGFGGLLFGINYQSFSGYYEGRVQRLAGNNVLMWGNRGHQAWPALGAIVEVLPDAAGGAYVMNSLGWGDSRVQHVDDLGNETWAAGGINPLGLSTWPNPSEPSYCIDGTGGFYAADGVTDLFAQHVDIAGNLLWGINGLQITTLPGWQEDPDLTPDGFGGALIVYRDHYFSEITDHHARALSATRLDLFGNKVWENTGFWWALLENQTGREPFYPQVLADGSGGALVVWDHYNDAFDFNEVYAAGISSSGDSPAVPTLAYINPDAGAVGDIQQVVILGDYLDSSQTYTLVQSGALDIVLTGISVVTSQSVTGTLDLSSAVPGAYDLQVSKGGVVLATLANAYGVGEQTPCDQDEPLLAAQGYPSSFGSQRKMAFDSLGRVNSAWLDYSSGYYRLWWNVKAADLPELHTLVYRSNDVLRELSFSMGPDDVAHFVFVEESGGAENLTYRSVDPISESTSESLVVIGGVRNPVVAVDDMAQVHIVYEAGTGPTALYHVITGELGFGAPVNLNAGTNATNPDLALDGPGLMVTYVRDFWWPGLREVCYQHFDGAVWETAVGVYFGVTVQSPSVAWDGSGSLLFSWVLDNSGFEPLLHTLLMTNHTPGAVRWRMGLPLIYRCSVAASGPNSFYLLTQESETGIPAEIYLRSGDGEVFYPRRRINSTGDVDFPVFCANSNSPGVSALWEEYQDPTATLYRYDCFDTGPTSSVDTPSLVQGVKAYPNPFNPTTTFSYSQRSPGWTRLEIYNLAGQRVRTLVDGKQAAGNHTITWDGRDSVGRVMPSGVYFSRILRPAGQKEIVTKVTMLK